MSNVKKYIGVKIISAGPEKAPENMGSYAKGTDGMRVVYEDGYESWSPQGVFDDAYRLCDCMTFGLAIEAMKKGYKVARKGWNGKGIFIEIQKPDDNSKMSSPYIFIDTTGLQTENFDAPKSRVPWLASQTDMLGEDWEIV